MTIGTTTQSSSTIISGNQKKPSSPLASEYPKSPVSKITETLMNITSTSCSYSSNLDASRGHIRLKMSRNSAVLPTLLPGGRRSDMKIHSLLHQLPCFLGGPKNSSSSSSLSDLTKFALRVIEKGDTYSSEDGDTNQDTDNAKQHEDGDKNEDKDKAKQHLNQEESALSDTTQAQEHLSASSLSQEEKAQIEETEEEEQTTGTTAIQADIDETSVAPPVAQADLDSIDLDNIKVHELHGLEAADGDVLGARYLNKLSRMEREHVLQEIHGVADPMEEENNYELIEDSLKKLSHEIKNQLVQLKEKIRSSVKKDENADTKVQEPQEQLQQANGPPTPEVAASEEQLGELQQKHKNHPIFGKLRDIGGLGFACNSSFKKMRSSRSMSILSSGFSSSTFGPTTAMALSSIPTGSATTNEAQQDAAILNSKDAIAYEQALAQCRGRRRERNNSLFRPSANDDDGDQDEGRYIDVEQRGFRLSFLRAERYDIKKAAKRFLDYFEEKRRLFGIAYLTTKIQLEDLDAETMDCLESGHIQLLTERDRAGRAVFVVTKKLAINSERCQDENCILRAFWILSLIALEDEETETKGAVLVNYNIGGANVVQRLGLDGHRRRVRQWGNVFQALPLRVASVHWCVENFALKQDANLSALMLGGSTFVRVRCHAGSDMDVQRALRTFGIPTNLLPVSMKGEVNLSRHSGLLRKLRKTEASAIFNKVLSLIEVPILDDDITLDVNDDEQDPGTAMITAGGDPFATPSLVPMENRSHHNQNNPSINSHQQQQQQQFEKQHRNSNDVAYNIIDKNLQPAAFNDSFCFVFGNRNPMEVQASLQHQYQQQQLEKRMGMGMVQQHYHQKQQVFRRHQQQGDHISTSKSDIPFSIEPIVAPGELDILLGRGRGAQNHKGNINYRDCVETFRARYEQIPQKGAKTQLIREVVAVIYDNGGRFLKRDGFGRWIPVDREVARDKVSHSFRNQKRLSLGGASKRSRDEFELS